MADMSFNTKVNQTIARSMLIAYLNTGDADKPVWSPVGKRVEESSAEYDWQTESTKDILDTTYTTMQKPTITQTFDPWDLSNGDAAQAVIWNKAVREQDAQGLCNMDMLIVHLYAGTADTAMFAERYDACAIEVASLGGEGGGNIGMPIGVTYGGNRTTGTAAVSNGVVTFTAD